MLGDKLYRFSLIKTAYSGLDSTFKFKRDEFNCWTSKDDDSLLEYGSNRHTIAGVIRIGDIANVKSYLNTAYYIVLAEDNEEKDKELLYAKVRFNFKTAEDKFRRAERLKIECVKALGIVE